MVAREDIPSANATGGTSPNAAHCHPMKLSVPSGAFSYTFKLNPDCFILSAFQQQILLPSQDVQGRFWVWVDIPTV